MTAGRLFNVQPDMHTTDRAFFGGKPFAQPVSADRYGRATDLFRTSISGTISPHELITHYHIILAHNRIVVNPHSYKYGEDFVKFQQRLKIDLSVGLWYNRVYANL